MKWLKFILDFIYPRVCGNCGNVVEIDEYICKNCKKFFYLLNYPVLTVKNKSFSKLIFVSKYDNVIRKLIKHYKFYDKLYLYKFFSELLFHKLVKCNISADIITFVPMTLTKLNQRGYNQVEIIARILSRRLEIPFAKLLIKVKNTQPQSLLKKSLRQKNLKNVFKISIKNDIVNKRIILVDDIYTTGSTVEECSKILKKAGAKEVIVIVIAKAS